MSFRPTIAVCAAGEIADIACYRDREGLGLLAEAAAIAVLYGDCGSAEAYRVRRYGARSVRYALDPEILDDAPEVRERLLDASEYSLIVDLDARCIYASFRILSPEELALRPEFGSRECPVETLSSRTDLLSFMESCRIPFSAIRLKREDFGRRPEQGEILEEAVVGYVVP